MEAANIISIGALLVAGFSVAVAYRGYRLSEKNEKRLLSDERLVFGPPVHPDLQNPSYYHAVLVIQVVNLGRRKATITEVSVADRQGSPVKVTWSSKVDVRGKPLEAHQLLLVDPICSLYIMHEARVPFTGGSLITIKHSQTPGIEVLQYDKA